MPVALALGTFRKAVVALEALVALAPADVVLAHALSVYVIALEFPFRETFRATAAKLAADQRVEAERVLDALAAGLTLDETGTQASFLENINFYLIFDGLILCKFRFVMSPGSPIFSSRVPKI